MIQHQNVIIIIQRYSNIRADNPDAQEIFQDQRRYLKMTFATKSQIYILEPPLTVDLSIIIKLISKVGEQNVGPQRTIILMQQFTKLVIDFDVKTIREKR